MDIQQYLLQLSEISSVEELRTYFIDQSKAFGATYVAGFPVYSGDPEAVWVPFVSTFPQELREAREEYSLAHDPFIEAAIVRGGPVQYSQVYQKLGWDERQLKLLDRLPALGILDSVVSPVSAKPGVTAFFAMTFPDMLPPMGWAELRRIHIYFQEFYARYWELTKTGRPQISARERQILIGMMRGKSKTEISEQLGLSVHTVDTYTRRCFEKLEANSRTEAAVKAFGLGLAYVDSSLSDG